MGKNSLAFKNVLFTVACLTKLSLDQEAILFNKFRYNSVMIYIKVMRSLFWRRNFIYRIESSNDQFSKNFNIDRSRSIFKLPSMKPEKKLLYSLIIHHASTISSFFLAFIAKKSWLFFPRYIEYSKVAHYLVFFRNENK